MTGTWDGRIREASSSAVASGSTLVIAEGWVVDDVARERLERQLARVPAGVAGVAADTGELPPGASFRVHAERQACTPLSVAVEQRTGPVRGVALVRPNVSFEVRDDAIDVGSGALLVDPGAHAHDPWQPSAPLLPASPLGRPPFPCRPVAVFLATEPDDEAADWARALVNGLVRNDVEGRIMMPEVAPGLHLTRPCAPGRESLDALAPDIVVALDTEATEMATGASQANRSLVIIESLSDIAATSELVSWRRGRAPGRVRARIGRRIEAGALASLIRRLCAGPHPIAPADEMERPVRTWTPGIERRGPTWSRAGLHTLAVITGEQRSSPRVDGLTEHLSAHGVAVEVVPVGRRARDVARGADLVFLDATARSDAAVELVAACSGGSRTVVDLSLHDLVGNGSHPTSTLTPDATRFVVATDAVTSAAPALHTAARTFGIRCQLLPTVLSPARVLDLRRMRSRHERSTQPVLAWTLGCEGSASAVAAVGTSLLELLDELPDLRVDVVGDRLAVPQGLRAHARVTVGSDRSADRFAPWIAHVWTPAAVADEIADDPLPFVEASCAAVPTLVAARLRRSIEGYLSRELLIEDDALASSWSQRLRPLVRDRAGWDRRSGEAAQRANALYGPVASEVVVNRFLGWMRYEET